MLTGDSNAPLRHCVFHHKYVLVRSGDPNTRSPADDCTIEENGSLAEFFALPDSELYKLL